MILIEEKSHAVLKGAELTTALIINWYNKVTRNTPEEEEDSERQYDQNVMTNEFIVIKKLSRQICEHNADAEEATDEKITIVRFFG